MTEKCQLTKVANLSLMIVKDFIIFFLNLNSLVPTTDHPESAKNYSLLICEDSFSSIPLSILVIDSEQ